MSNDSLRRQRFPTSVSRPVASPIQPSVVYASDDPDMLDAQYEGGLQGYTYSREGHPNATALAARIDAMEAVTGGIITSSGMAAVSLAILGCCQAGDHVLGGNQLYGRSLRLMSQDLPRYGIETSLADPTDIAAFRAALRPNTRAILVEVVSNPVIRVADMEAIAALAAKAGVTLIVDNTFTTPRGFAAIENGADIVVHSVTKLLAGHSDAMLGYVAAKDPDLNARIAEMAVTWGFTPSPFDCWLAERGLMSFDLRYSQAETTARALAQALSDHPAVTRILYPGHASHPDHNRATHLLGARSGNMVSFEITGGRAASNALVRALPFVPFAPTLGDIGTTLSHPASSSHRALTVDQRAALGMSEGFFRVSVGCEETAELVAEFCAALDTL